MNGRPHLKHSKNSRNEHGVKFGAVVFSPLPVEMSITSRRRQRQQKQQQQQQQQQQGGTRKGARKTRKGTPWTRFVKKIYDEMKRKDKNVKLGAAMKEASRRKGEMKE
jgi:hypothetical protein